MGAQKICVKKIFGPEKWAQKKFVKKIICYTKIDPNNKYKKILFTNNLVQKRFN